MIATEIILGRPCSGKTSWLIETLNAHNGQSLLVSLENPVDWLNRQGLKESVCVLDVNPNDLIPCAIIMKARQIAPTLVAIDNLELLPSTVNLGDLQQTLESIGAQKLLITAHTRRNFKPASGDRISSISCVVTVLDVPNNGLK